MSKRNFIVDIDLNKNQLSNAALQNLATAPTSPVIGQMYFNTTDDTSYMYVASIPTGYPGAGSPGWMDMLTYHEIRTALNPTLSGANVLATFQTNNTGHVVAATTRLLTLGDLGHGSYTPVDITNTTGPKVIQTLTTDNLGNVTAADTRNLTNTDISNLIINDALTASTTFTWSVDKIKDFVGNAITGGMIYKDGYDASVGPPPSAGVKVGWTYVATNITEEDGGGFWSIPLVAGDMIIALVDDPVDEDDWTEVNKNIPDIAPASETTQGIIELATGTEALAGTDTVRAITPATLKAVTDNLGVGGAYSQTFGDGTEQTFTITHNLGSENVIVYIREETSGVQVEAQVAVVDAVSIQVSTNSVPPTDFYRVTVQR